MYSPYKRLTAQLLLFSFLLESCYNPNTGVSKKMLPTPKGATHQQHQYKENTYSKNLEPSPSLSYTTADGHAITFTHHNEAWQAEICMPNGRRQLPVTFEPGYTIEDLINKGPTEQQQLIHVCPNKDNIDPIDHIYIGKIETHKQYINKIATKQPKEHPHPAEARIQEQAVLRVLPSPVQITKSPSSQPQAIPNPLSIPSTELFGYNNAYNTYNNAYKTSNKRTLSLKSQHALAHSQRAAQNKRTERTVRAKPTDKPAPTAQPRQNTPPTTPQLPSPTTETPQDIASPEFVAQGGQRVHFTYKNDQWKASVMERIRAFSRTEMLPVFCERYGDVAAALLALQGKPDKYVQQRIHVMTARQVPYVPKFVFIGERGLKGGTDDHNSETSSSGHERPRKRARNSELSQTIAQGHELSREEARERNTHQEVASKSEEQPKDKPSQAVQHFIGTDKAGVDLRKYDSWYDNTTLEYLAKTPREPQNHLLQVVFHDPTAPKTSFANQVAQLQLLKNRLNKKGALFISKEPGAGGVHHYLFGMLYENKLLLFNPVGVSRHQDLYEGLAAVKEQGLVEEVYLSRTRIQEEAHLVSCGPISAELLLHYGGLGKGDLEEVIGKICSVGEDQERQVGSEQELKPLSYQEVDISQWLPASLRGLLEQGSEGSYEEKLENLRESHLSRLEQMSSGLEEELPEQVLFTQLVVEGRDIFSLQESESYKALAGRSDQGKLRSASGKEWFDDQSVGHSTPAVVRPLAEPTKYVDLQADEVAGSQLGKESIQGHSSLRGMHVDMPASRDSDAGPSGSGEPQEELPVGQSQPLAAPQGPDASLVAAFFDAIRDDDAAMVSELLHQNSSLLEQIVPRDNGQGAMRERTPLMYAAQLGHRSMISLLLEQEALVNQANKDGFTPLMLAAQEGHQAVVEYLVGQGAQVNQVRSDGATPLLIAAQKGHLEVVQCLVGNGAEVNQAANNGATPLLIAAENAHLGVVQCLVENGAEVNQVANNGATPLWIATQEGHLEVVAYLVGHGALVNQADEDNWTPLMIAAQEGHQAVVAYLVGQGAEVNQTAKDGITPLWIAAHQGHQAVVAYLVGHGALVN